MPAASSLFTFPILFLSFSFFYPRVIGISRGYFVVVVRGRVWNSGCPGTHKVA